MTLVVVSLDTLFVPAKSIEETSFRETRGSFTSDAHFRDSKQIIEGIIGEKLEETVQKRLSLNHDGVDRQEVWCRSTLLLYNSHWQAELYGPL